MPIPATVEASGGLTTNDALWAGGLILCVALTIFVVLEFLRIVWRKR